MYLLPAIDILGGKAVRLAKGDYAQVTVYNDDPIAQARAFEAAGARWLHVVDLDGAKSGAADNIAVVEGILAATDLNVEVGGGVTRVVLGTVLVRDPAFAAEAVNRFGGDALVAGIDAKDGEVAVSGWCEGSGIAAHDLAARMADMGYRHLVYTDIARDGMQTGLDPQAYVDMARAFGHPVVASGGVASVADIERLAPVASSIEGVIAGRAIYEGALDVSSGVAACAAASAQA